MSSVVTALVPTVRLKFRVDNKWLRFFGLTLIFYFQVEGSENIDLLFYISKLYTAWCTLRIFLQFKRTKLLFFLADYY